MLSKTISNLENLFKELNSLIFSDKLPKPVITVIPEKRKNVSTYGWLSPEPIWFGKEDNVVAYELNICPENFYELNKNDLCGILIHEMCHLYNAINGIKDVSGMKHNKKFKETAERFGLVCGDPDKKVGFGETEISTRLQELIDEYINFDIDSFLFWYRSLPEVEKTETEKKISYSYKCPKCGKKFKIKYKVDVFCPECQAAFETTEEIPVQEEPAESDN
jgi:hypothetical protein